MKYLGWIFCVLLAATAGAQQAATEATQDGATPQTVDALMKLDLSAGVDVQIQVLG